MQPYFFPYLAYWQLILASDIFVIYDTAMYKNRGFINRNKVLLNGRSHLITLQLMQASQNKPINSISLGSNQSKLLKTIHHAYSKAHYYQRAIIPITTILQSDEDNLANFLLHSINILCDYLGIKRKILLASSLDHIGKIKYAKSTQK